MPNLIGPVVVIILTLSATLCLAAQPTPYTVSRASGAVTLQRVEAQFSAPIIARLGSELDAPCYAGSKDFVGESAISFGPMVRNPKSRPIYCAFHFCLLDAEQRLVAAGSVDLVKPIKPGEISSAFCIMAVVPKDRISTIKSYQAVLYEYDAPDMVREAVPAAGGSARPMLAAFAQHPDQLQRVSLASFAGSHEKAEPIMMLGLGSALRFDARYHLYDSVLGHPRVWAGGTARNTSAVRQYYAYSVAFFDTRHRLVGAAGSHYDLNAQESLPIQDSLYVPAGELPSIAAFDAVLYQSPNPFKD